MALSLRRSMAPNLCLLMSEKSNSWWCAIELLSTTWARVSHTHRDCLNLDLHNRSDKVKQQFYSFAYTCMCSSGVQTQTPKRQSSPQDTKWSLHGQTQTHTISAGSVRKIVCANTLCFASVFFLMLSFQERLNIKERILGSFVETE